MQTPLKCLDTLDLRMAPQFRGEKGMAEIVSGGGMWTRGGTEILSVSWNLADPTYHWCVYIAVNKFLRNV